MLTVRPGSQVHRLILMLSIVGEYPVHSLQLLGNGRVLRDLVRRLSIPQTFRNPTTEQRITVKLLQVNGRGYDKSIRLFKEALPILDWIYPDAYRYYMESFWNHKFPGDAAHRSRNHRVAETVAVCEAAGIKVIPYNLPKLQMDCLKKTVTELPALYLARDLKKIHASEQNKTMFTRTVGALFCADGCYAVYNTRNAAMKWNGMGEFKAMHSLVEVARMNAGIHDIDSAILLGESEQVALETLLATGNTQRPEFRFDGIYSHVYFVPMTDFGIRRLKMLTLPDWNEKLLDLLFDPETRSYSKGIMEYDAIIDNRIVFSYLDSDLARLIRFREALVNQNVQAEVLCFPEQIPLLREYLSQQVVLKTIDLVLLEEEFGLERRDKHG